MVREKRNFEIKQKSLKLSLFRRSGGKNSPEWKNWKVNLFSLIVFFTLVRRWSFWLGRFYRNFCRFVNKNMGSVLKRIPAYLFYRNKSLFNFVCIRVSPQWYLWLGFYNEMAFFRVEETFSLYRSYNGS